MEMAGQWELASELPHLPALFPLDSYAAHSNPKKAVSPGTVQRGQV